MSDETIAKLESLDQQKTDMIKTLTKAFVAFTFAISALGGAALHHRISLAEQIITEACTDFIAETSPESHADTGSQAAE